MTPDISVIILDDHPVPLFGMTVMFQPGDGVVVKSAHATTPSFLAALDADRGAYDAAIIDYQLAPDDITCEALLTAAHGRFPDFPMLVLSAQYSQVTVQSALRAGALGFLSKTATPGQIVAGLRDIVSGRQHVSLELDAPAGRLKSRSTAPQNDEVGASLTEREREVLMLVLEGLATKDIADRLQRTTSTISTLKRGAYRKLGIHSNIELFKARHLLNLGV